MLRQLLCIFFLGFGLLLSAQSTNCSVGLVLKSVEAEEGDTVTVDVTVRNFSGLVGLQYNHSWNPDILDFVDVFFPQESVVSESNFNMSPILTDEGLLNFVFIDDNLDGLELDDNTVLYQIGFIYQGGGTSQVSTNGDNIVVEIIDNTSALIDNYYLMHATVGPDQQQVPPFDAYPYPSGVCINGQACDETEGGSIFLDITDDQISTFNWTGPNGFTATNAEITGLSGGIYQLVLTHESGRTSSGDFYVGTSNNNLNLTITTDADECGGSPDGSALATVEGGSGNYSYSWNNGATSASINNLEEGNYAVTVTDIEGGCSVSASVVVSGVSSFPIWYNVTPASCGAISDGSIVVFTDAPTEALPLTYQWSNGQTTPEITGLSAGYYELTLTAANGCVSVLEINVSADDFLITGDVVDAGCGAEPTGSISLPLFPPSEYDISWSTGESGTNFITDLVAGVYAVTVVSSSTGCSGIEVFVVEQQGVIAAASVDCYLENGVHLADLDAAVWNNDDGPYLFDWSNGISNTAQQISSITVSENGIYSVTITSANGCTSTIETIEVNCLDETAVGLYLDPELSVLDNGGSGCFQVLANGFDNIAGFQFSLSWNENLLDFTGVQAFNLPAMTETNFGLELGADGALTVSWIDLENASGVSLPDGSPLFEVCYDAIATEAINATINITSFPTLIEFFNDDDEILTVGTQSAIVYLNGGSGGGTDEFIVTAGSATVDVGNNVCVPVSIGEINDLVGFQFALGWDPSALLYTGVQSLNLPNLDESSSFGSLLESQTEGRLRVIWNDLNITGLNLAEETVAFEVCFLANGPIGEYPLFFDSNTLPIEAVNASLEYMSTTTIGGVVTIEDDITNPNAASLRINSVAAEPGESFCVPVEVVDFNNIIGMQFSINWDDELLTFNSVEVVENLNFLTPLSFNAIGGDVLVCSWIDESLEDRSFAEGTVIFELCFTAAEEEGTAGIIFSNQPTTIEFISGLDIVPFIPVNGEITISLDGLVWPGDFNNDGTANNMDALHLGLGYGATGPERNNPSINWQAQYADLWMIATPQTLTDYRHIDADGNGLISAVDSIALSQNWAENTDGLTGGNDNGTTQQNLTGAPVYLQEQTVQAGARVRIPIMLGTDDMVVEDAYGVAFTITYEPDKVVPGSPHIFYNGWLDGESDDMIGMYHDFTGQGRLEVVMVRTDGQNVDGSGQLAELSIIMEDVIILSLTDVEAVFNIENVRLISYSEMELATSPRTTNIIVEGVTAVDEPDVLSGIQLSPNPTAGLLHIAHAGVVLESLSVQDAKGRLIDVFSKDEQIDLSIYPAGVYFLRIQTSQGVAYRRVVKHE